MKQKTGKTNSEASTPAHQNSSELRIPVWALPALIIVTSLVFARALHNGITSFDDDFYILKNPFLKDMSLDGIKAIFTNFYAGNYHPLTTLAYLIEYNNFGAEPLPYHAFNVALHLLNTWLVYAVCRKLSDKDLTAIFAASFFALHPMHVESVAWISETKDVLYTFFYLSAIRVYLSYISAPSSRINLVYCLLLFTCSLFSKSAAVTLPVLLIAIDIYRKRKLDTTAWLEKIPFFALSLLFGILNIMAQSAQGAITSLNTAYGLLNRIFLFCTSISFYLTRLIVPVRLSAMHFFPGTQHSLLPWYYYLSLPFLAALGWLISRKTPYRRDVVFGTAFFLITISVMLQVLAVGAAMASERYTYVPYIGLFFIAGQWLSDTAGARNKRELLFAAAGILLLFAGMSWMRIGVWENDETLFGDIRDKDVAHANGIAQSMLQRGMDRMTKGNLQGAMDDINQAILFCPTLENAWFQRGVLYYRTGDLKSAISDYSRVLALNPRIATVYSYRGWAYYQVNRADSAIADYNMAIALDSTNAEAYNNRGWALYNAGQKQAAMADYNKALAIDHRFSGAYNNRGWAFFETGKLTESISDFDSALAINPRNNIAHFNLGMVYSRSGDASGAIREFTSALAIEHNDASAILERGKSYLAARDTANACIDLRKAASAGSVQAAEYTKQYCR